MVRGGVWSGGSAMREGWSEWRMAGSAIWWTETFVTGFPCSFLTSFMRYFSSVRVLFLLRGCPFLLSLVLPPSSHGISPVHLARFTDLSTYSINKNMHTCLNCRRAQLPT